jgi:hypothetical protein
MRSMFKLLGAACAALTLTACVNTGAPTSGPINPEALIPIALTTCADAPAVPPRPVGADGKAEARDDQAKATYIAGLHGAYADCKSTVAAIAVRRHALDVQAGTAGAMPPPSAAKPPVISIPAFASNPLKL